MTPQERQLIDDLFDRLTKLENTPRDPEAMSAIMQGLRSAPNAVYALVQTALVQDEALKRAHDRIEELEGGQTGQRSGGFLDPMRETIFGQNPPQGAGSVPNVRAPDIGGNRPTWNSGQVLQQTQAPGQYNQPALDNQPAYAQGQGYGAPQPGFGGGSFLGTAAAAAAGAVGGSLLLGSIRSMMGGGHHQQSFGGFFRARRRKRKSEAVERPVRQRSGARRRYQRHRLSGFVQPARRRRLRFAGRPVRSGLER